MIRLMMNQHKEIKINQKYIYYNSVRSSNLVINKQNITLWYQNFVSKVCVSSIDQYFVFFKLIEFYRALICFYFHQKFNFVQLLKLISNLQFILQIIPQSFTVINVDCFSLSIISSNLSHSIFQPCDHSSSQKSTVINDGYYFLQQTEDQPNLLNEGEVQEIQELNPWNARLMVQYFYQPKAFLPELHYFFPLFVTYCCSNLQFIASLQLYLKIRISKYQLIFIIHNKIIVMTSKAIGEKHKEEMWSSQQNESIPIVKMSNFNIKISGSPRSHYRYSEEQKIMNRRQIVVTPFSNTRPHVISRTSAIGSNKKAKVSPQIFGEINQFKYFNPQNDRFVPFLKQHITQLQGIIYKKSQLPKNNHYQNIHFAQFMIAEVKPIISGVLHSRSRRDCPFMKAAKARGVVSCSKANKRTSTSYDSFKSIEVANNSKYASSKKIGLTAGQSKNPRFNQIKKKLENSFAERVKSEGKRINKGDISDRIRQKRRLGEDEDCKPWQTKKIQNVQYDAF